MIVCVCNNISDREIRQAVDLGLSTMAELRRDLGVATCCGKCHTCAKEVLNGHLATITTTATQMQEMVFTRPVLTT